MPRGMENKGRQQPLSAAINLVDPCDNERNAPSSRSTSPKRRKSVDKNEAKYGDIEASKDDNGDTVVHITIKSSDKDKKKRPQL